MAQNTIDGINRISLFLPFYLGKVNCYLFPLADGFALIDSGGRNQRKALVSALRKAGVTPGRLKLILLTHGDFDHAGNTAFIQRESGGKIALHADELPRISARDMTWERKGIPGVAHPFLPAVFRFGKDDVFTPDILLTDGMDLSPFGFPGSVITLPGHTNGSVGFLTTSGDLFCGDLLVSRTSVQLNGMLDDPAAANKSLHRLRELPLRTIYPGHGHPFRMDELQRL